MRQTRVDLDGLIDTTRAARTDRLAVLFDGPRLVPGPPENLLLVDVDGVGPVVQLQHGTSFVPVVALAELPEPLRTWIGEVIPYRALADDDEGGDA